MVTNYATITARDADGHYIAWHPEFLGCLSDGESPEEARANLEDVLQMTLDHLREYDLPIPEPFDLAKMTKIDLGEVL